MGCARAVSRSPGTIAAIPGGHPQAVIVGYGTPPEPAYPAALEALATVLGMPGTGDRVA